ncbi:MAG: tetratricopeptide repeat protein, partial [Planctomycetota bacterium]
MRIHTLILLLLFAASAVADDVILKDGRVLSGKVVDEGKRFTVVDRDRKYAVPKSEVASLVEKQSFMDEYEARLAKLPYDDPEAIFEFGRWLAESEWPSRAARAYEEVLELDPEHRGARRALGYKLYEGEWVGPEELNRRQGLVKFEGRWYT